MGYCPACHPRAFNETAGCIDEQLDDLAEGQVRQIDVCAACSIPPMH
jgi:hypothetical protein